MDSCPNASESFIDFKINLTVFIRNNSRFQYKRDDDHHVPNYNVLIDRSFKKLVPMDAPAHTAKIDSCYPMRIFLTATLSTMILNTSKRLFS